jgi:membrane-associated HD superfamily phosphohydrolase
LFTGFVLGAIVMRLDQARIGRARIGKEATRLTAVERDLAALEREMEQQGDDLTKQSEQNIRLLDARLGLLEEIGSKEHEKWQHRFQALERGLTKQITDLKAEATKEADAQSLQQSVMDAAILSLDKKLQDMQAFIIKTAEEAQGRRSAIQGVPAMQEMTAGRGAELNEMLQLMASLPAQQEEFSRRRAAAAASGNAASGNAVSGNAANFRQPAGADYVGPGYVGGGL